MLFLKVFKNCIICTFYKYKNFLCTLFRLIFIALQNVGVISAIPCICTSTPQLTVAWYKSVFRPEYFVLCTVVLKVHRSCKEYKHFSTSNTRSSPERGFFGLGLSSFRPQTLLIVALLRRKFARVLRALLTGGWERPAAVSPCPPRVVRSGPESQSSVRSDSRTLCSITLI